MAKINIDSAPGTGGGGGGGNLQLSGGASMTSTLTSVTDTSNTSSPLKLSTTAVQVLSPLRITTSDASGFYLDAEDSATNNRFSIKRDPSSQEVTLDFASNPAGSTTLVGAIRTYGDGVNLSNAMSFREDGNVGIGTDTPGAKLDIHSAGATVAQFNKTGSGNSYIQQLTAGAAKWKHGFTSASGAFDIIDDVNSLTRLSLLNTGQLKLNAYTSTSAFTGTTAGFLAFDSTGNILSVAAPGGGSPAGTTGAIQFNNGGAFGADSTNFFWDDTNKRLKVSGTSEATPSSTNGGILNIIGSATNSLIIGSLSASPFPMYVQSGGSGIYPLALNPQGGQITINTTTSLGAQLGIKGSGSTSATTALLVQNSLGNNLLQIGDSGLAEFGTTIGGGGNQGVNATAFRGTYFNSFGDAYTIFQTSNSTGNAYFYQNVSIGSGVTPVASAALDVVSTTKGFLPPRMTNAQRLAIATPAVGLIVYCTDAVEGLYIYKSTGWTFVI